MDRSKEVIERARSQVDRSCYVWGCEGQDLNAMSDPARWIKAQETTGDRARNVARDLARYEKLKAKGYDPILCFDCSGFVYWSMKVFDGLMPGRRNAATYYSMCDAKNKDDLRAGDLVFVHNGTKVCHVGLYAGGGMVIHCKGRDVGVIEEAISRHGWNRFGRWPKMYDEEPFVPGEAYVIAKGTVNIRTGPGTEFPIVGVSSKYLWLGDDPETGWHQIEYNGEPAWISGNPKYTEVTR